MTGIRKAREILHAIYAAELKAAEDAEYAVDEAERAAKKAAVKAAAEAAEEAALEADLAEMREAAYAAHMATLFRKL